MDDQTWLTELSMSILFSPSSGLRKQKENRPGLRRSTKACSEAPLCEVGGLVWLPGGVFSVVKQLDSKAEVLWDLLAPSLGSLYYLAKIPQRQALCSLELQQLTQQPGSRAPSVPGGRWPGL